MKPVFQTRAADRRSLCGDKKPGPRNRLDIHRYAAATKRNDPFDEGFSIGGEYPQIRYPCVDADVRAEMAAQPLRPDLAGPPPEFMFAGLAIGSLPVISDGAVEYAAEE